MSLILVGCNSSNDKKARKVIKEYLKSSMNDFSSYEPVEFSSLDSTFSTFFDTDEGEKLNDEIRETYDRSRTFYDVMSKYKHNPKITELYEKLYQDNERMADSLIEIKNKAELAYKTEHEGYKLNHKFRGKNALGAFMLYELVFFIDKDISKVINVVDKETYDELQVQIQRLDSIRQADIDQSNETNKMNSGNSN